MPVPFHWPVLPIFFVEIEKVSREFSKFSKHDKMSFTASSRPSFLWGA